MGLLLDVRDARLEASVAGEGPVALVWGHGVLGDRSTEDAIGIVDWPSVAEDVRLVRYDARGHGGSSVPTDPEELRWNALGLDMLAVAEALGGEGPRFLGGASMGCATALHAALAVVQGEVGRVDGLVLMIPPVAWDARRAHTRGYAAGAAMLRKRPDQIGRLLVVRSKAPFGRLITAGYPESATILSDHVRDLDAAQIAVIFEAAARSDLPAPADLARIACPALLLAWEGDPGHPVSTAETLHELLPDSELHVAGSPDDVRGWSDLIRRFVLDVP